MGLLIRRYSPSPEPPLPLQIGGLVTWFDLSDVSTQWQDSDKTTPVVADDDLIGAVEDKSGNGNDALQTTSGLRITYKTGIQNGLSVGRFGGTQHLLATLAAAVTGNETTIIVAGVRTSIVGNFQAWGSLYDAATVHDHDNAGNCLVCYHGAFGGTLQGYRNGDKSSTTHPGNGVPYLTVEVYDGANHTIYHNGTGATPVASTGSFAYNRQSIGARWESSIFQRHMTGDLFEILIYESAISEADRMSLESYLNTKWTIY